MKVIGFCGLPGSGKSTALNAVKELGKIISMGDVIRNEAKKRNIELTGDNLGNIANELREKNGPDIIAKNCVILIQESKSEIIFVDGVRSTNEVRVFRNHWKFPLISIEINEELRIKLLIERTRSDDSIKIADIRKRDEREKNFGLIDVIKTADISIVNDSTKENLEKKTLAIVKEVILTY